jgi:hypothetical protein
MASVGDQVHIRLTIKRHVNPLKSSLRDIIIIFLVEVFDGSTNAQRDNIHGSGACSLSTTFSSGRDYVGVECLN